MSKSRYPYSRADETEMWLYLYEQLRRGVPAASEPKGLRIWKMYADEKNCGRSADSLTSRFRKNMINRLHDANLPCHKMMFLYLELQLPMDTDVKTALELKYGINIDLKLGGTLKRFRRIGRAAPDAPLNQAFSSSQIAPLSPPKRVQQAESMAVEKTPTNEGSGVELSPGISNSSVWATPSSVDFTRQIRQIEDESKLRARHETMIARRNICSSSDGNDDDGDRSQQSTSTDLSDALNPLQSSKSSVIKASAAEHCEASQSILLDKDAQVESVQYDVPEHGPSEFSSEQQIKEGEGPIVVSTMSDSCQESLARLCNAYGLPELHEQLAWRHSKEVSFLTGRWEHKIEEIIGSYELSREDIDWTKSAIMAKQTQLLALSQTKDDYLNSLIELKNLIKKELDGLVKEYHISESEEKPVIARNFEEEYSFHMRHSYEQISSYVRKGELERIASQISDSVHGAHVIAALKLVEVMEDLTAATSENTSDYTTYMAEVKRAVRDRISQILEVT